MKQYYIYILTNPSRTILYVGVTNNIKRRISEHRNNKGKGPSFAGKNYCNKLVYFESFNQILIAIAREKQIKRWSRKKKEILIERKNPNWEFLNDEIYNSF